MLTLEKNLRAGLQALQLTLTDVQVQQLLEYQALILKWTKVYNLTAVRDPADMLTHHLLDSLAVINPLRAQLATVAEGLKADALVDLPEDRVEVTPVNKTENPTGNISTIKAASKAANNATNITTSLPTNATLNTAGGLAARSESTATPLGGIRLLDVGSGAGLPGAVIAICCPELTVHCVDTVAKKAAFIQQVAVALKLPNLKGLHARVENLTETYQVVSSRAFASLQDFTQWSTKALAQGGIWMGMKGKHPAEEMAVLPPDVKVFHVEPLTVPGLDAERCIVWMQRA